MKSKLGNTLIAVVLAATMVFAIGCSDDDDSVLNPPAPGKTPAVSNLGYGATSVYATLDNGAMLRAVHASPDAPAVDIYVEGSAGSYTVELRAAGSNANDAPAYSVDLTIDSDDKITAVAAGLLFSSDEDDKFRLLRLNENFDIPGANEAIVRIVHASPDAPMVGLDLGDNGTIDVPNFARFSDTGGSGVALPADTELQVAIWANGSRVTAFTTPQLPAGAELFVIATGLLSKQPRDIDGFTLLAVAPTGSVGFVKQNPVVFALHASPDAPNVDIYAGSAKLVDDLAFGRLSEALQVPPASYTLDFKEAGTTGTAASLTTPELAAGERYLAIASGFLLSGDPNFRLLPFGDSFDEAGAMARVRVVHASPDAPIVDVGTVDNNVLTPVPDFTNLDFEDASPAMGTPLPVGTLPIGIALTGETAPAVEFDVTTAPGLKAFAIAAGSLGGTGETFRLVIVDATNFPWQSAEISPKQ